VSGPPKPKGVFRRWTIGSLDPDKLGNSTLSANGNGVCPLRAGTSRNIAIKFAIAAWSLVHGYATLAMDGALEFIDKDRRPGIDRTVRFVEFRN
jgi:hypothetical protein